QDGGVDSDQLTAQVDERAARIAGVDGGIRLDEVLVAVRIDARAGQAADDPRGDRVLQPEGIADGDPKSPTSTLAESPRVIWVRFSVLTLSTATSEGSSLPTMSAFRSRPSCRVTVISLAFSTTCALVTM